GSSSPFGRPGAPTGGGAARAATGRPPLRCPGVAVAAGRPARRRGRADRAALGPGVRGAVRPVPRRVHRVPGVPGAAGAGPARGPFPRVFVGGAGPAVRPGRPVARERVVREPADRAAGGEALRRVLHARRLLPRPGAVPALAGPRPGGPPSAGAGAV